MDRSRNGRRAVTPGPVAATVADGAPAAARARLRGLWSHLERLGGGIGTRGPGETQIETDRRLARDRIAALRRRLERVKRTRAVQRSQRERAATPTIALVGYTNAGKSTLLNALTDAEVG